MSAETLKQIIENTQMPQWRRAVQALQAAFAWCNQAATAEHITAGLSADQIPQVEALRCLIDLQRALQEGVEYLESLPGLYATAKAGPTLREELSSKQARLREVVENLARMRGELEQLTQLEEDLKSKAEEQQRLKSSLESRRAELERLSQLANPEAVEALQAQVKELEERLQGAGVEQLQERLREQAGGLIQLRESHLQALHPQVGALLREAEDKERELQENIAALEHARMRYEQARSKLEEVKAELEPYMEADKIIVQAIPGTNNVLELLRRAESLFVKAQEALGQVMEKSEREAQLSVVSITGEPLER